jgi:hypothetical protein
MINVVSKCEKCYYGNDCRILNPYKCNSYSPAMDTTFSLEADPPKSLYQVATDY